MLGIVYSEIDWKSIEEIEIFNIATGENVHGRMSNMDVRNEAVSEKFSFP